MPDPNDLPSSRRVLDLASGYEEALILEAAVRLEVFDYLDFRPMTLDEVCQATKCSPRGMRALLNALVALDLLDKYGGKSGDRYALTAESAAYLVSTSPDFQGQMCKHVSRLLIHRWLGLTESVRTGRPAPGPVNDPATSGPYFREFVEDIFPMSYEAARGLADALKIRETTTPINVLDLAAGSGVWGIALAEASPLVHVTAVDWESVLPVTRRVAEKHDVASQFTFKEGDLLTTDFGTGHHIATLGHIIHSEGENRSRQLLKKLHDTLAPGGTVVIAEFLPNDDRTGPTGALIFACTMLVNTEEGDTFTYNEMAEWLRAAGFENVRELDVPGPAPLILADKPQ
jgi:ubiquinone/menaquinone biosynthesis C-methylase UbiE